MASALANASIFSWGADKMQDAWEEVTGNVRKILQAVSADGRTYPFPERFKEAVYVDGGRIRCRDQLIISARDLEVEEAVGCVIVGSDDIEVDRAANSLILAEGRITSKWRTSQVTGSLLASDSRVNFDGSVTDSTVYARSGAKIGKGDNLAAYDTPEFSVGNSPANTVVLPGRPLF